MGDPMVPALRFSEFDGSWKRKKLGYICTFFSGGTPNTSSQEFYKGKISFIGSGDIYKSQVLNFISELALKSSSAKLVNEGDLLFALYGANSGEVSLSKMNGAINQAVLCIRTKVDDIRFLYFLLLLNKDKIVSKYLQGGQGNLSAKIVKTLSFGFPSLSEQQKIADFLSSVDKKIEQLTRKKELLEKYKTGMMQKLFPKAGEQHPELRFKDDNGQDYPDWEVVKGKHLFYSHSNKNHNGDLPILAATQDQGMVSRADAGIEIFTSEKSIKSYKIVEAGDFVISLRSFQGGIEYSKVTGICSPAYIILKPYKKIIDSFFVQFFKKETFIEQLSKTVVGIRDGKQISYDAFGGLKISIPSFTEQQKIADFLSAIDDKITKVEGKLTKAQTFKKGLLQQMFV